MRPSRSVEILRRVRLAWLAGLLVLGAAPAFAATLMVTNTSDGGPGSLREAIALAADGDTIDFNLVLPNTIALDNPLVIASDTSKTLTINGPGASLLTLDGGDGVTVLIVQPLLDPGATVTATISGLTIARGSAALGGGIYNGGTLSLVDCVVRDSTLDTLFGGGIFNAGRLTLTRSLVTGNTVPENGLGGGIFNAAGATLSLVDSQVSENTAGGPGIPAKGGGIYNDRGEVTLTRATVVRNASNQGAGIANAGGTVTALRSSISANDTGPSFGTGGGIANVDQGTVTLTESTVAHNHAGNFGGGIFAFRSALRLIRTTVSDNVAQTDLQTASQGRGGGLHVISSLIEITNSSVARNRAQDDGGGMYAGAAVGAITHATFALNSSTNAGSGIAIDRTLRSSFTIGNSLIAGNSGHDCSFFQNHDLTAYSRGYNIAADFGCPMFHATDREVVDAGLDAQGLRNNGGPTETVALAPTSPARNAIPPGQCRDASGAPVPTDQRGVPRPQSSGCDIGAVEMFQSRFPIEAVQAFDIIGAVRSSSLPPGQQKGLVAPLEGAVNSLARGAVTPAMNQLDAFIHHVDALTASGALAPAEGGALTTDAQAIIDSLGRD